jgi:hypothetical protein
MTHISGFERSQLLLLPEAVDDYVGADNLFRLMESVVSRSRDMRSSSLTWDKILEDSAGAAADAELKNGRFTIPAGCPIEGGKEILGSVFGPILIMEAHERIRASGAGILHVMGIARNDGVAHVKQKLDEAVTPAVGPAVLAQLIEMIAVQSGLGAFFNGRRRIGIIDRFSRAQAAADKDGPLFVVRPEKPDFRSREPMRRVRICREAAASDRPCRLHVILKNFDEVLSDLLLDISPGQSELFVEANGHQPDDAPITDPVLYEANKPIVADRIEERPNSAVQFWDRGAGPC